MVSHANRPKRRQRTARHASLMETMEPRCLLSAVLTPDHVVVVLEQNRTNNAVGDVANMPYSNQLASTGLVYTNAHGITHPTEPNTLAIYSGFTQFVSDNGQTYRFGAPNIASALNSKLVSPGVYRSFIGYVESLPADGDMTTIQASDPADPTSPEDLYARIRNPMAQFTDAGQRGSVTLGNARVNKTFANFPTTDAGYAALPTVAYVVPNGLDSGQGSNAQPAYSTDPAAYDYLRGRADTWLQDHLGGYVEWAKTHNSLLIVVTDEESTDSHPSTTVTSIVNGDPHLFLGGTNSTSVNHYNLLRTLTDMYGLTPLDVTATMPGLPTNAYGRLTRSNTAPTNLALSHHRVAEGKPIGTTVGTLSVTDPDVGDTTTYTLRRKALAPDNAFFTISGDQLMTKAMFNFEARSSYTISVRATDQAGASVVRNFTINIRNVNESPTNISLSNYTLAASSPIGTQVGAFTATDPDFGNTFTYSLVDGTGARDNADFTVVGRRLFTNALLDAGSTYKIRVRVTDQGGLWFERGLLLTAV